MSTTHIDGVSVATQANVFFDGKCVSHTLTRADGVSFTGVWRNGCFRQGARWSVFLTTTKECGFE